MSLSDALAYAARHEKNCIRCKVAKPLQDFYKTGKYWKSLCKTCNTDSIREYRSKNLTHINARRRALRQKNLNGRRKKEREARLKHKYKITEKFYQKLLSQQGGTCAICQTTTPGRNRAWSVDHCHNSGTIRGLLCNTCNRGIGLFKDNPKTLTRAIIYLSRKGF